MNSIAFLLWSPDISGGTNVIFEHATRMRQQGHDITIICDDKPDSKRLAWFPGAEKLNWLNYNEAATSEFDIAIATWWRTVFSLHTIKAKKYAYFVQSIESRFYPEQDTALRTLVNATYSLPLNFITEATWIKNHLQKYYQQNALLVRNGINKSWFNEGVQPEAPRVPGKLRVLVEGPLNVSFKNTELAVALCRQSQADEVWLVTSTETGAYPGVDRLFSRVPVAKIGAIYASCDVLVKLSTVEGMFGPPLEIFHTGGTSVSYDVTGYDEYIEHGVNGLVSFSRNNQEIIDFINRLKNDAQELAALKRNALSTAGHWPDWEKSSEQFDAACQQIIHQGTVSPPASFGVQSTLFWSLYEETQKAGAAQATAMPVLKKYYAVFRQAAIRRIRQQYPSLFSLLRKIKWTLHAYLPGKKKCSITK